jgi:hypothetical protein
LAGSDLCSFHLIWFLVSLLALRLQLQTRYQPAWVMQ